MCVSGVPPTWLPIKIMYVPGWFNGAIRSGPGRRKVTKALKCFVRQSERVCMRLCAWKGVPRQDKVQPNRALFDGVYLAQRWVRKAVS